MAAIVLAYVHLLEKNYKTKKIRFNKLGDHSELHLLRKFQSVCRNYRNSSKKHPQLLGHVCEVSTV